MMASINFSHEGAFAIYTENTSSIHGGEWTAWTRAVVTPRTSGRASPTKKMGRLASDL